jgi:manganese/zinc/iron transport system substrate-binding protein
VRRLENADIIFYNGLHLEAGMATVLERMGETRQTIAVTRDIDPKLNLLALLLNLKATMIRTSGLM